MNMINVKSSNVAAVGFEAGTLAVRFSSGTTYTYQGVPQKTYEEMLEAKSVGQYFGTMIRPNYTGTKIEPDSEKK